MINRKCGYFCKWRKTCARFDRNGSNMRSYCLPDLHRHGYIEKKK